MFAALTQEIRLADPDGFDLGPYIAEQAEVLAPLLGIAAERLLAADGMPNLQLASQLKVLLRRRAEEQEQRLRIAAQARVEASVAQLVQTARWSYSSGMKGLRFVLGVGLCAAAASLSTALGALTACSTEATSSPPEPTCDAGAVTADSAPPTTGDQRADECIAAIVQSYQSTQGLSARFRSGCVKFATDLGVADSWADAGDDMAIANAACTAAGAALGASGVICSIKQDICDGGTSSVQLACSGSDAGTAGGDLIAKVGSDLSFLLATQCTLVRACDALSGSVACVEVSNASASARQCEAALAGLLAQVSSTCNGGAGISASLPHGAP